jgi:hypothetical protein
MMHRFPLPDAEVGRVRLVVARDGGVIGRTAITRDRLRDPMTADRLRPQPERRGCIPLLREQAVKGLAVLIHRLIEIPPRPLALSAMM